MNNQNLIPLTTEKAREIGLIGGSRKTPRKAFAARLRALKRRGLTDETSQHLYALMTDPEYSSFDILFMIYQWKDQIKTWHEMARWVKLRLAWHRLWHGARVDIRNRSESRNTEPISYKFVIEEVKPKEIVSTQASQASLPAQAASPVKDVNEVKLVNDVDE